MRTKRGFPKIPPDKYNKNSNVYVNRTKKTGHVTVKFRVPAKKIDPFQ